MAKFNIKTVKPKFTITTAPDNKIDVVVNKPILTAKNTKTYFKLKNTGGLRGEKGEKGDTGTSATIAAGTATSLPSGSTPTVTNTGTSSAAVFNFGIPKGDKGDKGDTGATGATGSPGEAATISVGTTSTGLPGTNASVTNTGTSSAAVLNFTIPKGEKGDKGDTGSTGSAATVEVGATSTGAAGTNASVTNTGTSSAAVLNFTIPRGDKGDKGDTGSAGSAATISVGTVTTGAEGSDATVTNSGTSSAAVFDFTIPRGATGATGGKGDKGDQGDAATISVGTTTTGAAGTNASVTNSGTTGAAVLDFTIPRGNKGDKGDKGDTGNPGDAATVTVGTVTTGAPGTSATVVNSGTSSAAVLDFTIPRGDKGESGSGAGDMLASDYDPNGTVQNAGGIVDYVGSVMPTVNDATLTITQNGTSAGTFTANASANKTIALTDTTYNDATTSTSGLMSASDKTKLNGIATGAEVNVQSDWDVADSSSDAFIKNKPTIPAAQVNSDWNANSGVAEILNKPTIPSKTSDLNNDSGFLTSSNAVTSFNGSTGAVTYTAPVTSVNGATGAVTISVPTVNNATLTIQKNGTTVKTFTANASRNVTANITVPTATSDLTNDSGFITDAGVTSFNGSTGAVTYTAPVTSVNGNTGAVTVSVPTATSDLTNDSGFITSSDLPTVGNATLTIQKNGTNVQTFTANATSNKTANITVPTATSDLTNDSGFLTSIPTASASTLGGIMVGSGLSIDGLGVLSASSATISSITNATIDTILTK